MDANCLGIEVKFLEGVYSPSAPQFMSLLIIVVPFMISTSVGGWSDNFFILANIFKTHMCIPVSETY